MHRGGSIGRAYRTSRWRSWSGIDAGIKDDNGAVVAIARNRRPVRPWSVIGSGGPRPRALGPGSHDREPHPGPGPMASPSRRGYVGSLSDAPQPDDLASRGVPNAGVSPDAGQHRADSGPGAVRHDQGPEPRPVSGCRTPSAPPELRGAEETPRGFRLAKEKARRRVDGAVALAMALCAAIDACQRRELRPFSCDGRQISSAPSQSQAWLEPRDYHRLSKRSSGTAHGFLVMPEVVRFEA